jgi:predicted amidohydrolase
MEEFIEEASRGAQLVVFPEDSVTGPLSGQVNFVEEAPFYLSEFQRMAIKYGVDIVPGTWTTQVGPSRFNTAYYINNDGSVAGSYHKINLWKNEKAIVSPGTKASVFPTRFGMVGLSICWDLAFPLLFSEMAKQHAKLIISPSYWSFTRMANKNEDTAEDEILLIDSLCTTRAFENNVVFVYCNAAGELKAEGIDAVLSGRSQVTHPHEKVICKSESNEEEILYSDVELT